MRLLKRHTDNEEHHDRDQDRGEAPAPGADPAPDHTGPAVPDARSAEATDRDTIADRPATDRPATDRPATDRPATDRPATDRPIAEPAMDPVYADDTVRDHRVVPDAAPAETVRDRPVRAERVETEDVVIRRWSWADAALALVGAALALVGILAMVRTGLNTTWFSPVESVLGASHTALLGAIETIAGVLLVLAALARSRVLATLLGITIAVGGAVFAIESAEVRRELAIEDWWAWGLVAVGVLAVLLAVVPRRGRLERVVRPD